MGRSLTKGFLALSLLVASPAWAAAKGKGFGEYLPSFSLDLQYGFTTYKSKMVESNDTSTGMSYALGGHAGEFKQFGFFVRNDSSTTAFELNSSSIAMVWQDSILRYYWGPVYIGAVFDQLDLKVNNQGTEILDVAGSGYGGNAGIFLPIGRIGLWYLDVTSVSLSVFRNTLATEVKAGTRLDIDTGAYFDITRELLDFTVGYKQRTMSFTTDSSYAEAYYITYLGFRLAYFF